MDEWAHESLYGFGNSPGRSLYVHRQRIAAVLSPLSVRRIAPDDVWVRWKVGPTRRCAGRTKGAWRAVPRVVRWALPRGWGRGLNIGGGGLANPFRSSRRFGLGFKRVCGRPEAATTAPASEKKKQPALVYMSSCPFSDLVVVVLIVAVVAVVAVLRALACSSRSMRQGLNGWNKSSSMLRSARRSVPLFFPPRKSLLFHRSGRF